MDDEDEFEIDTPNAAISLERPGLYRVYVDANGNTRFAVRLGEARVSAAGGEVALRTGEEMIVTGIDDPEYDVVAIPFADSWDRWVTSRELRRHEVASYDYTSPDVLGAEDLDAYGDWQSVPQYGRVWRPRSVAAGWAPYRVGHWIWQDPWGWTWVSSEPWGWAPYHYGRWVVVSSRWCWVPVAPNVRHVAYAPALVAFVGGGPGWSATVTVGGGGYVGWFPLAPRDPFLPWWGRQPGSPVSRNVVYTNRAYATVVERSAFVSARPAQTVVVRDAAIVRQLESAPVVRGPLPVLPTRESLRSTGIAAPRPPDAVLARPVAVRLAPPAAPPAFDRKVEAIREGRGAPLTPESASRLGAQPGVAARPAVATRPVVLPDRKVQLAPHKDAEGAPPPDPIRARSRELAMPQAAPVARPAAPERAAPAQVAPAAVAAAPPPAREAPKAEAKAEKAEAKPQARPAERAPARTEIEKPAPQARQMAPPMAAPPPQAAQAAPAPQPQAQPFSRPPRRVVEPGPDPIAHEAPAARSESKPEPKQEARPAPKQEQQVAPARGNEAPKNEQKQERTAEERAEAGQEGQEGLAARVVGPSPGVGRGTLAQEIISSNFRGH